MGLYLGKEKINNISAGSGISASDATATADDILKDKTAYVNGKKVTGTIYPIEEGRTFGGLETKIGVTYSGNRLYLLGTNNDVTIALKKGAHILIDTSLSNFGDATTADVAAGKTFTSSSGLKVTGTKVSQEATQYRLLSSMNPTSSIESNYLGIIWNHPDDLSGCLPVSLIPIYDRTNMSDPAFNIALYNDVTTNQITDIANPPANWIYGISLLTPQYYEYFSGQNLQSYIKEDLSEYCTLSNSGSSDYISTNLDAFGVIVPSCINNTSTTFISDYLVKYTVVV